ncbi:hypothetical protein C8R44DRAFT_866066 [Mycena epipterygia]|nr:hypothetical protein C8R44DRAFT_866066 [Mycena epipterygia]
MTLEGTNDNLYGVVLVAVVLSGVLYGIGVLQFWLYIRKYHSTDPILVKSVVIAVLLCDTCQQVLLTHAIYRTLVSSIANPSILASTVKTTLIQLYFGGAVGTLVQQFFCWRIYKFVGNLYTSGPAVGKRVVLPGVVSLISWVAFVVLIFSVTKFDSLLATDHMLETLVIVTNTLSAAVDVMISVILISLLYSEKTGFHKSTDILNRLIVFSFTTGLPTTVFALLTAVCTAAFQNTLLYLFFYILLGRLYTNSLLVMLNSRDYIKFGGSNGASGKQYSLELEIPGTSEILVAQPHQSRDAMTTVNIETNTVHDCNREDAK